jgi:hypothetical protein
VSAGKVVHKLGVRPTPGPQEILLPKSARILGFGFQDSYVGAVPVFWYQRDLDVEPLAEWQRWRVRMTATGEAYEGFYLAGPAFLGDTVWHLTGERIA